MSGMRCVGGQSRRMCGDGFGIALACACSVIGDLGPRTIGSIIVGLTERVDEEVTFFALTRVPVGDDGKGQLLLRRLFGRLFGLFYLSFGLFNPLFGQLYPFFRLFHLLFRLIHLLFGRFGGGRFVLP